MADQETVDLVVVGPFGTLDTRSAGPYADPKTASLSSNASVHYLTGALATSFGRELFQQFSNVAGNLVIVATYTIKQNQILYIVQDTAGNIVYYDTLAQQFGTLGNWPAFTEAIQSNGVLWLNNGRQIFYGPNGPQIARWQYPMPTTSQYDYDVDLGSGTPPLAAAIYSYAFVQKIHFVNVDSDVYQYTTPNGSVATGTRDDGSAIYPFHIKNPGTVPNAISGIFAGTTDDGYPFTTQVYRYSTNSPTWFLLTTLTTNETYEDSASDASISGNQQLVLNQDPPPTGTFGYPDNPIAAHQDRAWVIAIINNNNTSNLPQTQLWYSQVGEPWSFDEINAVLLVEDEETTLETGSIGTTGVPFGDFPSALEPLGSSLMTFRRQTTSLVYGVDESTYQAIKIFADLGCIAPLSVIRANGLIWWLSAQGFYSFDGSNVQWISEAMYNELQAIGPAAWISCQGFYKDLTCFWSFPNSSLTMKYYIPGQKWETLPYVTPSAVYATALPSDLSATPLSINQVCAVRPNSTALDFWEAAVSDLGGVVSATYQSQETDSGQPSWQKSYTKVMVCAPIQPGVTVDISLIVNENVVQQWMGVDLGVGQPTKVMNVTRTNNAGTLAQLQLVLHNAPNATTPAIIYSAKVGGTQKRAWIVQNQ